MNRWSATEVKTKNSAFTDHSLSLSHTLGKQPNPREEADSGVHQAEAEGQTTDTHPVARETEDSTEYVAYYSYTSVRSCACVLGVEHAFHLLCFVLRVKINCRSSNVPRPIMFRPC